MSARLAVDLAALSQASDRLAAIAAGFDTVNAVVDQVTAAIGCATETHELRAAVEHCAGAWRIRRGQLHDEVHHLSEIAGSVAQHLESTDLDLAANLASSAGSAAGSGPR